MPHMWDKHPKTIKNKGKIKQADSLNLKTNPPVVSHKSFFQSAYGVSLRIFRMINPFQGKTLLHGKTLMASMTVEASLVLPLFLLLMILSYQKKETEQAVASQIKRKKGDREPYPISL